MPGREARPKPVDRQAGSGGDRSLLRDRILGAAFTVFSERGSEGASTLEIATRAKVSKRDLYALFDSKEALLAECTGAIAARAQRINQALKLPPPRDAAALAASLETFGTRLLLQVCQPVVLAIHRLAVVGATRSPQLAQVLHDARAEASGQLAKQLKQAQARALLGKGEAAAMAEQFNALLWGDLLMRLLLGTAQPPSEQQARARARAAAAVLIRLYPAPPSPASNR